MKNPKISILGCGWLGFPLAVEILLKGFEVSGSTTSNEKMAQLRNAGINSFLISVSEKKVSGDILGFLSDSQIVIINIPPKLRGANPENYVGKIKALIPYIEESGIEKIIFIGSTAVYPDENQIVSEDTIPYPKTENGKQLLECEDLLRVNNKFQTTIIRFGGLIGPERHPVKYLAGKNVDNPQAPINLIHLDDCIGIILKVIEAEFWNETINAVSPFHPTREEYYHQKALDLNVPLPIFSHKLKSEGKIVNSAKAINQLGYKFSNNL
jgi:nucleoside-diphosphate-sugar epimerase